VRTYLLAYAFPRTADGKPDRATIEAAWPKAQAQLALLDKTVAASGYLVGDGLTLADIFVLPILHHLRRLPESGQMLTTTTPLGRYLETHAARPSYVRTVPPPGPPRRAAPAG
jgi:glutathione S-transferase